MSIVKEFNEYRAKMNERLLAQNNIVLKRFFSLDNQTYQDGALPEKTKELLGLVASMVLRCDDCIKYHLGTCYTLGVTTDEVYEVFSIANLVGGFYLYSTYKKSRRVLGCFTQRSKLNLRLPGFLIPVTK